MLGGEVRRDGAWEHSAPLLTSPITGLDLTLERGTQQDSAVSFSGTARVRGQPESPTLGGWRGSIAAAPKGWIRIEVDLALPDGVSCSPELVLWLGTMTTMRERQFATFRQTRLIGPTINSQGLAGNDLPFVFLFDPAQRIETMLYIPAGTFTWSRRRLLDYRCDRCTDPATGQYGVGLVSSAPAALVPGRHRFLWYVRQRAATTVPGEWEAQRAVIDALEPLLGATDTGLAAWGEISAGALQDLLTQSDTQITVEGVVGHPAYVLDTSQVRAEDRRPHRFELMTHADLIPPLALYLQLHPDAVAERHLAALIDTLPLFHHPEQHWLSNFYPTGRGRWIEDLWYFFENGLIKLPWTAAITRNENLWAIFLDALAGATTLARNVGYVFPLFADVAAKAPFGSSTNYSVGGMYAYGHLLAHAHNGREEHIAEARAALATLGRLPLDRMWHEPQQLGFAAAAAALLSERHGEPGMASLAEDLLQTQLRMVYWDDRSPRGEPLTGLFQACASLLYPAFKENIESILPWPHLLRAGIGNRTLLLRLIDAQRRHNGAYFDAVRGRYDGTARFIPYENLGTVELAQEGRLGKEIYGTGEVFWLYLLREALGRADDPEILVCSLDIPARATLAAFPPATRSFLVFNGTAVSRRATVIVPGLPEGRYHVEWGSRNAREAQTVDGALTVQIELGPSTAERLRVVRV